MTRYVAAWGERGHNPTAIFVTDNPAEAWRWLADTRQDQEDQQCPDVAMDEPYTDTFYELELTTKYVGLVGPAYTKTVGSVEDPTNGMEYSVDIYVDEEED